MFARLCAVVGLPQDERFATNESRVAHADELAQALEAALREHPAEHWLTTLREAKVPAGPINGIDEAFALAEELGMEATEGPLIRPPLRLDGARPPIRRPPPGLDEHGPELRAWLGRGYSSGGDPAV